VSVVFKENGKIIGRMEGEEYIPEPGVEYIPLADRKFSGGFPMIKTGKQFTNSRPTHVNPVLHAARVAAAEKAGVSTTGKEYISQLGRYSCDPEAWVSDASDVKRICEKNNWACEGLVDVKAHETPPEPDIPISKKIWDRRTQAVLMQNPGMLLEAAREKAFNEATGKVEVNPIQRVTDHNFDMD
jgi:hypothetical protein